LIFDTGAEWEKVLFSKWCKENWIPTFGRMKLDPYLIFHINNSKWIKNLNIKLEI
jgi:hypothetical protein